jgi:hypothetical protein
MIYTNLSSSGEPLFVYRWFEHIRCRLRFHIFEQSKEDGELFWYVSNNIGTSYGYIFPTEEASMLQ